MDTTATATKPGANSHEREIVERLRGRLGDLLPDVKKKKKQEGRLGSDLCTTGDLLGGWGWSGYGRQGLCHII